MYSSGPTHERRANNPACAEIKVSVGLGKEQQKNTDGNWPADFYTRDMHLREERARSKCY